MPEKNKGVDRDDPGQNEGLNNPLHNLYVDRDELSRVLYLWKQTTQPDAAVRIREIEDLLDEIDKRILEIEIGKKRF